MYLVQQFRDGKLRQSKALAEFSIIVFLKWIPRWQIPFHSGQKAKNSANPSLLIGN